MLGAPGSGKHRVLNSSGLVYCKEPELAQQPFFIQWKKQHVRFLILYSHRALPNLYLFQKVINVFLIFFNISDRESFTAIMDWKLNAFDKPKILVGTCFDFEEPRKISYKEAVRLQKDLGAMLYLECSGKTGEGINELLLTATAIALDPNNYSAVSADISLKTDVLRTDHNIEETINGLQLYGGWGPSLFKGKDPTDPMGECGSKARRQIQILELIIGTRFQRLILKNWWAMQNEHLIRILQHCPDLRELDISGCRLLTPDVIVAISKFCPNIEKLYLNNIFDIFGIKRQIAPISPLRKLRYLENEIEIKMPLNRGWKVIVLGNSVSCKFQLIDRYLGNAKHSTGRSHLGVKVIKINPNTIINLDFFEIESSRRYETMSTIAYRGAVLAIIVFHVAETTVLEKEVEYWIKAVRNNAEKGVPILLVANKIDSNSVKNKSIENRINEIIYRYDLSGYVECSAKDSADFDLLESMILKSINAFILRKKLEVLGAELDNFATSNSEKFMFDERLKQQQRKKNDKENKLCEVNDYADARGFNFTETLVDDPQLKNQSRSDVLNRFQDVPSLKILCFQTLWKNGARQLPDTHQGQMIIPELQGEYMAYQAHKIQ